MYIYIYTCMAYMYTYIIMYVYIYNHIYIYVYISLYNIMHECMYGCMYVVLVGPPTGRERGALGGRGTNLGWSLTYQWLKLKFDVRQHCHPWNRMNQYLVGGWATPLKNMKVNWDDDIPNIWENKSHVPDHQPDIYSIYIYIYIKIYECIICLNTLDKDMSSMFRVHSPGCRTCRWPSCCGTAPRPDAPAPGWLTVTANWEMTYSYSWFTPKK